MNEIVTPGHELATAAAGFIGTPFRLHGRTPDAGLDCVGLVTASLAAIGRSAIPPRGYGLRNTAIEGWMDHARLSGFEKTSRPITVGDILLSRTGPGQHHLMIAETATGVIHAHAGLRRVVRQPLGCCPQLIAQWRLTA